MLGRGTGVPETLGKVADLIDSAFGERVPDKIVAACGGLLLAWRATRNDPPAPRREGLASAARAFLDAFGGNVPDWLASEAQALEAALPCIDGAAMPAAPDNSCGQCEGTGTTQSASNLESEECPVCDGMGTLPEAVGDVEGAAALVRDALELLDAVGHIDDGALDEGRLIVMPHEGRVFRINITLAGER